MASLSLRNGIQESYILEDSMQFGATEASPNRLPCLQKDEGYSLKYAWNGHETYWLNGKRIHLAPGEALFINHRFVDRHRFSNNRLAQGLCLYYKEADMRKLFQSLVTVLDHSYEDLYNLKEFKLHREHVLMQELQQLFRDLETNPKEIGKERLYIIWSQFLAELKPLHIQYANALEDLAPATRQSILAKIVKAEEFMRSHLAQAIQLEEISREVGMSPFHFQRMYKKATGISPNRRLLAWRMEKAQRLLIGESSILEISTLLSYNDLATFSKAFKRCYGQSPQQWRKAQQKLLEN